MQIVPYRVEAGCTRHGRFSTYPGGRGGKERAARNERSSDWPRGAEPPAPETPLGEPPDPKRLSRCGEGPGHSVLRHLVFEVMLDAQHMGADAFASVGETIAVAQQPALFKDHMMVAIGAVDRHAKRLCHGAGALETLRLLLVAVGFGDQAVQMRLEHADILAHA